MNNKCVILIITLFLSIYCYAENLGVIGKTYPIIEPDMIEWIKTKASTMIQTGQWQQIQNRAITNAKMQINNPKSVIGITDAEISKTWYYRPMIELKHDLIDTQGHIIAKTGLYNALRYKPFDDQLLFINGNNQNQVQWAINHEKNDGIKTKIVLTQGSFMNLDKKFKIWFYYDQNGKYTQKLQIQHVPAIVVQDGDQLKISEIDNKLL